MEEIEARLRETSEQCLTALVDWIDEKKAPKKREALRETVHELRKVASRLEIELAISERDDITKKHIPIPSHRDSRKKVDGDGDNAQDNQNQPKVEKRQRRRPNNGPKKAAGGDS